MTNVKSFNINNQEYGITNSELSTTDTLIGDFGVRDENGNVLVRLKDGHIQTKNFDSSNIANIFDTYITDTAAGEFGIRDEYGNVLVRLKDGHIQTKNFDSSDVVDSSTATISKKKIRVLSLGNSWSMDAFGYVPPLLEDILGDEVEVQFGILHIAGCSLSTHYSQYSNNLSDYYFVLYTTDSGKWSWNSNCNLVSTLQNYTWDIIIFQQWSYNSRDYSTYQPYLNNLIRAIYDNVEYPIKLAWHMTPPYPTGWSGLTYNNTEYTSETMYTAVVECTKRLIDETAIEVVFPNGTAIINAMTTSLDSIGDYGHLFYEGQHLQDGVPCLLEAYVATQTLLDLYGFNNKSIFSSTIRPVDSWITSKGIPGVNGSAAGVTEDNVFLSMEIALMSYKKPYEITDCSTLFE